MNKTSILTVGLMSAVPTAVTTTCTQRTCGTDSAWIQAVKVDPKDATCENKTGIYFIWVVEDNASVITKKISLIR